MDDELYDLVCWLKSKGKSVQDVRDAVNKALYNMEATANLERELASCKRNEAMLMAELRRAQGEQYVHL